MPRVLIVDDKPENLYLLRALLRGHGWEVDEARNGAEALAVARERAPDLAVTDLLMPVMDGYTLLRGWKADPRLKAVPLVVYTATYTDPQDEKLALDLGADAFVLKPCEPEVFLARLDQVLSPTVRGRVPVAAPTVTEEPVVLRQYSEALIRRLEEKTRLLELSNRDLRAILDTEPGCVKQLDREGRFLDINASGLRMLGMRRADEVVGSSYLQLIVAEDLPTVRELVAQVFRGESGSIEYRCTPPTGESLWVVTDAVPLRSSTGEITAMLALTRDITARKETEARVEHLSRLYATLSQVNQTIVRVKSREELFHAICRATTECGRLLGTWIGLWDAAAATLTIVAASGEGAERRIGAVIDTRAPAFRGGVLEQALLTGALAVSRDLLGESASLERSQAVRDGVRGAAAVPFREAGAIVGLVAMGASEADFFAPADLRRLVAEMSTDISFALDGMASEAARRRAVASLRNLSHAVNAVGDVVFTTDPDGTITSINEEFTRLYGFAADEVVGRVTPRVLRSGAQAREFYERVWADLLKGGTIRRLMVNRAKDGRLIDVEATLAPFRDAQGRLAGFMAIQRDVSDRRRAEAEAQLLQSVALGVAEAGDLDSALALVLRRVCEATGWAVGEAWVPGPDGGRLVCHPVWHGAAPGLDGFRRISEGLSFAAGEGLPGRVWQTGRSEWCPDPGAGPGLQRAEAAAGARLPVELGVPVLARGRVLLVLDFFLFERGPEDLRRQELIAALGAQVGTLMERQQATEALRESEGKFRSLFENSLDGIFLTAPDGRIFAANPAACRLLKRSEAEICRLGRRGVVDEADPRFVALLEERARTGATRGELSMIRGDGSLVDVEMSSTQYTTPCGARTCTIIHDVSERRRAMTARREAERFAAGALSALSAHIAILDADGVILTTNDRWRRFAEANPPVAAAVCEGANYLAVCDAATGSDAQVASAFAAGIRDVVAGRVAEFALEYPCHSPTERRWFTGRVTRFTDAGAVRVVVAHENITMRKLAEEQTAASEEHFRRLIENASDIVTELDERGLVRMQGPSIARQLGYGTDELVGHPVVEWVHDEDRARVEAAIRSAFALPGQSVTVEYRLRHQDGSWRTLESIGRVARTAVGEAVLVVNSRDMTDRRQLEAKLVTAERMASMGTLAAGVAHEINNPLAAVIANLDLAIDAVEAHGGSLHRSSDLEDELRDAHDAAHRVRAIVRDLRIFARAEEERTGPVDVRQTIESAARMAWNEVRHHARIEKAYCDVPTVEANEARLGQVFLNLIMNAAQAIPVGQADANVIRIATRAGPSATVVVEIADTGVGLTPEVKARLFEPFFTTKPAGVGTGLGLMICQRIVTAAGGRIEVESAPGQGTTFRVILPGSRSAAAPVDAPRVAEPQGVDRRGRVLVVDDEELIGKVIQRSLGGAHHVVAARSARDALDRLTAGERFDVILCDVMMPVMSGIDFLERLEGLLPGEGSKVIFLTGGAFAPEVRERLDRSSNLKVEKPFDPASLRALVAERLQPSAGPAVSRA